MNMLKKVHPLYQKHQTKTHNNDQTLHRHGVWKKWFFFKIRICLGLFILRIKHKDLGIKSWIYLEFC